MNDHKDSTVVKKKTKQNKPVWICVFPTAKKFLDEKIQKGRNILVFLHVLEIIYKSFIHYTAFELQ